MKSSRAKSQSDISEPVIVTKSELLGIVESDLAELVAAHGVTQQAPNEYSVAELSLELGKNAGSVVKLMTELEKCGEWQSRRARLVNGHPGRVYSKVKK